MEIIDTLMSDKKTVIIMAIAYVIVMVVALIIIWKPDSVLEISKYEPYDETAVTEKMAKHYFSYITDLSVNALNSNLDELLVDGYTTYSQMSLDEIKLDIKAGQKYPTITDTSIYKSGSTVYYIGTLVTGKNAIRVNIIEEFPYDFKISFNTFIDYEELNDITNYNGIKITLKDVYKDFEYVEYNIEILNESESTVNMDFSVLNNVYIELQDGQKIYLNNPYDTSELKNMETNDVGIRNVIFKVPVSQQENMVSLNIDNVEINGVDKTISILL